MARKILLMSSGTLTIILLALFLLGTSCNMFSQKEDGKLKLLTRGDDMGFTHAANVACIKAYKEGILRSVEVMVPTPYFLLIK